MRRIIMSSMSLAVLLVWSNGVLFASAAGELRERAKALREEGSVSAENGDKDLGGRLESESVWMLEAAERLGDRPDISLAGELRERAKALMTEASAMVGQGKKALAGRLESEADWKLQAAERLELAAKEDGEQPSGDTKKEGDKGDSEKASRPDIENQVQQLKEQIHSLRDQERKLRESKASEEDLTKVREQISGVEGRLRETHAHSRGNEERGGFHIHAERLQAATRRLHHLRISAENLKMAEEHDLARQIMEKVEAMEREVQEGQRRLQAEMQEARKHQAEHSGDAVRELREQVERLRAEVKELREKNAK
jgi:hypothetical protein